ncbi:MAG: hypothetical protein K6G83_11005, partial [Lachnospiraceae bacterium]|nr:hypothetical protein [Lachnospiraceae bacterium]
MKYCPHCEIHVGGTFEECPLCQSPLQGDATLDHFPRNEGIQSVPLWVKLTAFLLMTGAAVCLSLDFLFLNVPHVHFGLIVLIWCIAALWYIRGFVKGKRALSPAVTLFTILFSIGAVLTEMVVGYHGITTNYIVPGLLSAALLANFILSILDKSGRFNALLYVLGSIFIGLIPCVVILLRRQGTPLAWEICFSVSVVALIGLLVFKRR